MIENVLLKTLLSSAWIRTASPTFYSTEIQSWSLGSNISEVHHITFMNWLRLRHFERYKTMSLT